MKAEEMTRTAFPAGRRRDVRTLFATSALLALVLLLLGAASASAQYVHSTITGEYGKEGPKATGLGGFGGGGGGCRLAYQSEEGRLYVLAENKIFALHRTGPGVVSPVSSPFPLAMPFSNNQECGEPDIEVDNSSGASKGNLYWVNSSGGSLGPESFYGWNPNGTALAAPWPIEVGESYVCGLDVDNAGNVYVGFKGGESVIKYSPSGAALQTIHLGYEACKLAVDRVNGDLFVAPQHPAEPMVKYTAASGYADSKEFPPAEYYLDPGLAINHALHRLYVGNNSTQLKVYDTETAALIEEVQLPGEGGRGLALDESTDTLFVAVGEASFGRILEMPGIVVPNATTGGVSGTTVSGSVDPAGGGPVTSCVFQYGTDTGYEMGSQPCEPATPYAATQSVSATLPGLTNETLYHYRIKVTNAAGTAVGEDKTFTPHSVTDLTAQPASAITRTGATLNASYTGNGEETFYYFEWGLESAGTFPNTTATPPGPSNGLGTGPQTMSAPLTGLTSDTTYNFRVVAQRGLETSTSATQSFTTKFAVLDLTTGAASLVQAETATLHGSWTGDGTQTNYQFEWGPTTNYGVTTPVGNGGMGSGPQSGSAPISGLAPNTVYHYRIIASDLAGDSVGADQTFKSRKVPKVAYLPPTDYTPESVTLNATVNPQAVGATTYHFEYGEDNTYGQATAESASVGADNAPHPVSNSISGLTVGGTYHYRIVATGPAGVTYGADQTFTTEPYEPTISSVSTSAPAPTTADLHAEVKPGFGLTIAYFEYGSTASYGQQTAPGPSIGSDNANHAVNATISGLKPGTVYHFRAVAVNYAGTAVGPDQTFTTGGDPRVLGGSAGEVGQTTAVLSAQVNPALLVTNYHFEFGLTAAYGSSVAGHVLGAVDQDLPVSTSVAGLSSGTTYHFRVVATNAAGTTVGSDIQFTTQAAPAHEEKPIPCKKGFVKRHGKCVKKKKRHHRKTHHRSASGRRG